MRTEMKFTRRFFSVLFVASLIFACSKDGNDGAIGPQGAQGEQGPAGPQGADGVDGIDGEDGQTGTANVIYSDWTPSEFDDDIQSFISDFTIDAPELTEDIKNTGTILVYGRYGDEANPIVNALPVTFGHARYESYYFEIQELGAINIQVQSINPNNIGSSIFEEYRYVLIPGGVSASGKSGSSVDYSKITYEEIAERFNIPD